MRHLLTARSALTATAIVLAAAATAACGEGATTAQGTPASTTTTSTTSGATSAATSSPTTWSGPERKDPRAGTEKAVLTAKPVVTTKRGLPFTEAEQKAAAAWADKVVHAAHLDMSKLPAHRTPDMWTKEMTKARHAAFAKAVKDNEATFGATWAVAEKNHARATKVERYVMKFEWPYKNGIPDFDSGAVLIRATWLEYFDFYASPERPTDMTARVGRSVLLRVVRGPSAAEPFKIDAWEYLDLDKGNAWQYQNPDGTWSTWK